MTRSSSTVIGSVATVAVLGLATLPWTCVAYTPAGFNMTMDIMNEAPSVMVSTVMKELTNHLNVTNIVSIAVALFAVLISRQVLQLLFSPLDVRKTIEGDVAQRGAPVRPSRSGGSNTDSVVSEDAEFVVLPSTSRRSVVVFFLSKILLLFQSNKQQLDGAICLQRIPTAGSA